MTREEAKKLCTFISQVYAGCTEEDYKNGKMKILKNLISDLTKMYIKNI